MAINLPEIAATYYQWQLLALPLLNHQYVFNRVGVRSVSYLAARTEGQL